MISKIRYYVNDLCLYYVNDLCLLAIFEGFDHFLNNFCLESAENRYVDGTDHYLYNFLLTPRPENVILTVISHIDGRQYEK